MTYEEYSRLAHLFLLNERKIAEDRYESAISFFGKDTYTSISEEDKIVEYNHALRVLGSEHTMDGVVHELTKANDFYFKQLSVSKGLNHFENLEHFNEGFRVLVYLKYPVLLEQYCELRNLK